MGRVDEDLRLYRRFQSLLRLRKEHPAQVARSLKALCHPLATAPDRTDQIFYRSRQSAAEQP